MTTLTCVCVDPPRVGVAVTTEELTLSATEADEPGGGGFEVRDAPALGGGRGVVDRTFESVAKEVCGVASTSAVGLSFNVSAILQTR